MNILLLSENWPPRVGGIENYLTNIAEHLNEDNVTVIAPKTIESRLTKNSSVKVVRKRFFWPIIKPAWLPLWWYIYKRAKNKEIDVTLCGKALFEGLIGYYLKKHFNIPYVVFTYAMEIETWKKKRGDKKKLTKVLQHADRVICINEVTKRALLDLGVKQEQLVKLWPGVDEKFLDDVHEDDIEKVLRKYDVEKPYVLSVSRLIKRKGHDTLMEAFSELDQTKFEKFQLVLAGDGPEADNLMQQTENLWIDTTVNFLGTVDDEDLPALYKGAELYALTPRDIDGDIEGFGIVYLEANATGIPVLGTKTGGVPEAIIDNQSGVLVKPDSVAETRKALEKLLSNKKELKRLGENGKKRVEEKFRWPTRIEKLHETLNEIVKK